MVGETTMNRRNGSTPSPPNGVAKGLGKLTHDIVSLAELEFELFRIDLWARAPRSRGPMVLRHWLRTRLETQALVSGRADHPDRPLGF